MTSQAVKCHAARVRGQFAGATAPAASRLAEGRTPAEIADGGRALRRTLSLVLLLTAVAAAARSKPVADDAKQGTKQAFAESLITSDRMEMDFAAHVARFDGHVVVKDPRMTLKTDRLIAFFSADNQLTKVEALGNVVILQPQVDRRAEAGHATYDIKKGTIVLTETPTLTTGLNMLSGAAQITYYRDSERVVCEGGQPTIRIVPKKKPDGENVPGILDKLSGAGAEKGKNASD
ncbi:MAG: hypothetical protein GXP31_16985 [Kiritimatiellaeota bacterium]|nr:hypothetical protein [Kiritimatiellota bacterium]